MSESLLLHSAFNVENKSNTLKQKACTMCMTKTEKLVLQFFWPLFYWQEWPSCSSCPLGIHSFRQEYGEERQPSSLNSSSCSSELMPHTILQPVSAIKILPLGTQNKTYKIKYPLKTIWKEQIYIVHASQLNMTEERCNTGIAFCSQKWLL